MYFILLKTIEFLLLTKFFELILVEMKNGEDIILIRLEHLHCIKKETNV